MSTYFLQVIKAAEKHIAAVTAERSYYRSTCKTCDENLKTIYTVDGSFQPPPPAAMIQPMTNDTTGHYSFDMAQQVFMIMLVAYI